MLFNSLDFIKFFFLFFGIYWFVLRQSLTLQNLLILLGSYIFYGWWDWHFCILIALSTCVDFVCGKRIYQAVEKVEKKRWLWISILFNLGLLGFFKYFNFFIENFILAFSSIGVEVDPFMISIIIPVGISFYTFQTMSYSIDIYRDQLKPTDDFIGFAAFVAFFPQLVAGPIERASNLLPQILAPRDFDYENAKIGLRLILWGLLKKIFVADSLAPLVNNIFENHETLGSGTLVLGALFFSIQIYCDFSGYTDIAIGVAKLLGIQLMDNFKFPYFSRNIGEFWRRWHISLSTWFRDYLYIPLGGSRIGKWMSLRNVFIIFLVSGFWHGANWTFIVWGLIHALLFVPSFLLGTNRKFLRTTKNSFSLLANLENSIRILFTFICVTLAWIYFRAETLTEANEYLFGIFTKEWTFNSLEGLNIVGIFLFLDFIIFKIGIKTKYHLEYALAFIWVLGLIYMPPPQASEFIYFQF